MFSKKVLFLDNVQEAKDYIIKAKNSIKDAELLYDNQRYDSSLTTSYFTIISVVKGLLLLKGRTPKTHKGIIHEFGQYYVKEGLIDRYFYRKFAEAQSSREQIHYDLYYKIDENMALSTLNLARKFIKESEKFFD